MHKLLSLPIVVTMFLAILSPVAAQDPSIEQLTEKIKLLSKENELLNKEIALLKKEIEQLSTKEKKAPPQAKASLNDIFVVGAKFSTRSQHTAGPTRGTTGIGTMTVTSRDGDVFTATNTWVVEKDGTSGSGQIQGKITAPNKMRWKRVDAPTGMEVQATLRPDGLFVDTFGRNANGVEIKGVIDVSK